MMDDQEAETTPALAPMRMQAMGGTWLAASLALGILAACGSDDPDQNQVGVPSAGALLIMNTDDSVARCTVNEAGEIRRCVTSPAEGLATPGTPELADRRAYVGNLANHTLAICDLNSEGALTSCHQADHSGVLSSPFNVAVNQSSLYVTNDNGSLAVCTLDGGGMPLDCSLALEKKTLERPVGLAVYGDFLMIAEQSRHAVRVCDLGSGLSAQSCRSFDGDGAFNQPAGMTISEARL